MLRLFGGIVMLAGLAAMAAFGSAECHTVACAGDAVLGEIAAAGAILMGGVALAEG